MGLVNRALAAIAAMALAVAGALALFELGAIVLGARPLVVPHDRWLADLSTQPWSGRSSRLACLGLIAAGVVLVALQLLRQRPAEVAAAAGAPVPARVPRRDLERDVAAELRQVQGVATVAVKLRRHGFDVKASAIAGDLQALREQLTLAARSALEARGVDAGGPVKVNVARQPEKAS